MFERLDQIEARYEELTQALASPEIVTDSAKYQKTAKAHSEIAPVVEKYREYKDLTRGIVESKVVLAEEKHHPRNPRWHRRRRSHALCRGNFPNVHALCRNAALESRSALDFGVVRGWTERSHRHYRRQTRLFAAQV